MARKTCFSYEASGHKFRPLDGLPGYGVLRLFCPTCGRVIPANQEFNTAMWSNVDLPEAERAELELDRGPVH